ncbi:MAG: RagB/SusD family nutrient uptake outer membrane protein [Bacteroidales bacterium]|nr:RagB/SusD family nutrient uptake outer membrane protein [Bacteroidales bacterium]MBN2820351.1 RagB/SusD family nutrient uptake outer membrane protein [Bacteroidales bacterium]
MKNYLKLIAILFIYTLTTTSCEDYLQSESPSTFTEETAFSNVDFAEKELFGAYSILTSTYGFDVSYYFFLIDNDIEFNISANDNSMYSVAHYAIGEGGALLEPTWNNFYSGIERANICIDNLPNSPIWEGENSATAKKLYGEAVTLRALYYYNLIMLWGDVPFKTKSTQGDDNFFLPKTDRDEIYEYLIQDLKEVEDYVPWMTETTERVNKAFVKGLRARMALAYAGYSLRNKTFETRRGRYWQEYYQIARDECLEVMESGKHRLNPSFENVFKILHKYNMDLTYKEDLFEIAPGRLYSGRLASWTIGLRSDPSTKYGQGGEAVRTSCSYYYSFDREDNRREVASSLYYLTGTGDSPHQSLTPISIWYKYPLAKWRRDWIEPSMGGISTGVNLPLMRYSDILLMFAEAENEINGPTAAAKEALALVRKRAFPQDVWTEKVDNYIDSISASKDAFFNAIVDERGWEFGGELLRKFDLVRWNLLGPKIQEMKDETYKILHDDAKYANLVPDYIFWKMGDDGETIDILNPDYRISDSAVDGYTKTGWLPTLGSTSDAMFTTLYEDRLANGYDPVKNNHLLPISATTIANSGGMLSNDQIP